MFLNKYLGDKDFKEVLTKGFSFLIIRVFGSFIGYAFIVFITNYFGADVYGLIALGFSIFLILSVFGRLGLDTNIVKFFSQGKNDNDTAVFFKSIFITFIFSAFLSFLVYLFRDIIVLKLYKEPKPGLLPYIPWILAAIPFWNVALICSSYLRAKKFNISFAFINNPSRFLFSLLSLLILILFIGRESIYIVIGHFYGVLITALIALFLAIKHISSYGVNQRSRFSLFVKESFPMLLSSSMLILLGLVDTQVMGIYETNTNIGIYSVCLKIATLTSFSLQALNSILAPKIAKSYAEDNLDYKKLIAFSTKINFFITLAIIFLIVVFHDLVLGFFGDEFRVGSGILFVFCVGQIINSFSGSVGVILQMIGKQKVYQNFVVIALLINLILTFILTPVYGGFGAAISTVISMAFWNIGSALYLKLKMNITSYFSVFAFLKNR